MSTFTYAAAGPTVTGRPVHQAARDAFVRLLEQLLDQGRFALHQLRHASTRASTEVRLLIEAGYLRPGSSTDTLELTPLALRASEERMLLELFGPTGPASAGGHLGREPGPGAESGDESQFHLPGTPLDHLDVSGTLRQALVRGLPLAVREEDVQVRPGPSSRRCVTVLLLDLSGSMAQHGKFAAARRAALALRGLVRRLHPGDELITAGFASRAMLLPGRALLEATPKSVGLFDPNQGVVRLPANAPEIPEHFTNVQAGLRLARQCLRGKSNASKQVLLITDGEPTAHLEGQELVLSYPPGEATERHTLVEARRCAAEGIGLGVFGLLGAFRSPGLQPFVERLARAGRGVALCCPPRRLGPDLLDRCRRNRTQQG